MTTEAFLILTDTLRSRTWCHQDRGEFSKGPEGSACRMEYKIHNYVFISE